MHADKSAAWAQTVLTPNQFQSAENSFSANVGKPSSIFTFEENGTGTILFYQNYCPLFYKQKQLDRPFKQVVLRFFPERSDEKLIELSISNKNVTLSRTYPGNNPDVKDIVEPVRQIKGIYPIFPDAKEAPEILYKKLWVQLNRITNEVIVSVGDMYNSHSQSLLTYDFDNDYPNNTKGTWQTQEHSFPMPSPDSKIHPPSQSRPLNILSLVKRMAIYVVYPVIQNLGNITQQANEFMTIKFMKNIQSYSPVMEPNPSVLDNKTAPLADMPKQIQILYGYLEDMSISTLPDFKAKNDEQLQRLEYLAWRDMRFAIQDSLVRKPGYVDESTKKKPIGILNHLYKMKYGEEYQVLDPTKAKEQWLKETSPQIKKMTPEEYFMKKVYERPNYLRLELLPHAGLGPGSMAVLEIWPPYNSSILHNHGEAYGLIKVLTGSIRVENFNELNFKDISKLDVVKEEPFLKMDYSQGQYTWLSEYSFGIHRLVNLHPEVTLNLQAYYHNEDTTEYFTFVDDKYESNGKKYPVKSLNEYYPQNDWHNYINLVQTNPNLDPCDKAFIQSIIDRYQLERPNPKDPKRPTYNTEFYQLALILKDTYEMAFNLDKEEVPSWAVPTRKDIFFMVFFLDYHPESADSKTIIESLEHSGCFVKTFKNVCDFKSALANGEQLWRHSNMKFAIIDNMKHFSNALLNQSEAEKIFKEAEDLGINSHVNLVVNQALGQLTDTVIKIPKQPNGFALFNQNLVSSTVSQAFGIKDPTP